MVVLDGVFYCGLIEKAIKENYLEIKKIDGVRLLKVTQKGYRNIKLEKLEGKKC